MRMCADFCMRDSLVRHLLGCKLRLSLKARLRKLLEVGVVQWMRAMMIYRQDWIVCGDDPSCDNAVSAGVRWLE